MTCRQTGAALLASANAQEAMDLRQLPICRRSPSCLSYTFSTASAHPTNTEASKRLNMGTCRAYNRQALADFRNRALSPNHPVAEDSPGPDIYFRAEKRKQFRVHARYCGRIYGKKRNAGRTYGLLTITVARRGKHHNSHRLGCDN